MRTADTDKLAAQDSEDLLDETAAVIYLLPLQTVFGTRVTQWP